MSAWQAIDSAPRDGTEFIGWLTNDGGHGFVCHECRYNDDGALEIYGRVDYDQDDWYVWYGGITHWMPAIEPPLTAR